MLCNKAVNKYLVKNICQFQQTTKITKLQKRLLLICDIRKPTFLGIQIFTLSFNMKINFYGPLGTSNLIREVNNQLYILEGDSNTPIFQHRIQLTPTPVGVSVDSDYGFNELYVDSAL